MKTKFICFILFLVFTFGVRSQSLSVSGKVNSTSSITFAVGTAGDMPIAVYSMTPLPPVIVNSTSQSLGYLWKFGGIEGDPNSYVLGKISVRSSVPIPEGLQWTIQATEPSKDMYGNSTLEQLLTTTDKELINGIWSTGTWFIFWGPWSTISNQLTHIIKLTDFSKLVPTSGTQGLTVQLTYTLQ